MDDMYDPYLKNGDEAIKVEEYMRMYPPSLVLVVVVVVVI